MSSRSITTKKSFIRARAKRSSITNFLLWHTDVPLPSLSSPPPSPSVFSFHYRAHNYTESHKWICKKKCRIITAQSAKRALRWFHLLDYDSRALTTKRSAMQSAVIQHNRIGTHTDQCSSNFRAYQLIGIRLLNMSSIICDCIWNYAIH